MKIKSLFIKLMICVLFFNLAACTKEDVVFKIKDTEISTEQYKYYISRSRSDIISQYQENGEAIDKAFWERETDAGLTIAGVLKERAKQQCLYEQMILIVAEKKGLADSSSFESLEKEMEDENQERKKKIEKGQVVYGNKSYSPETYRSHYFSNLTNELMRDMEGRELRFTDTELMQYCVSHNKDIYNMEEGQTIRSVYGLEFKNYLFEKYIKQQVEESSFTVNQKVYDSLEVC